MDELIEGVQEFQTKVFQEQQELFERLKSGQDPDALFITCSDSRVNPNLITRTEPGELFILRNAGNIIPPYGAANGGEGATVEYAVLALGIRDIIVCGHSHCGAMNGLLHPEALTEMPTVVRWLRHAESTRLIMRDKYPDLSEEELLTQAARENVLIQIESLQTHPVVASRLAQGQLKLHGWMYHFETGQVFAYDSSARRFLPIQQAGHSAGEFQILEHPQNHAPDIPTLSAASVTTPQDAQKASTT
jgi:carbonic anhydrase